MAEGQREDSAELFAEIIQHVLDELDAGKRDALSEFMHNETRRVLADVPILRIPGADCRF